MPEYSGDNLEDIGYNFTRWMPPGADEADWRGAVPEPSSDQVVAFFSDLSVIAMDEAVAEQKVSDAMDAEDQAAFLAAHPDWAAEHPGQKPSADDMTADWSAARARERMLRLMEVRESTRDVSRARQIDVIVEFCGGNPSAAVLAAVPHRPFQGYVGYLSGLFSPEALAAATNG